MKQDRCANGCDSPVCPPSKVICRACLDRITKTLAAMLAKLEVMP